MGDDRQAEAIAAAVTAGATRRVVGCGGMGKTHLLDRIAAALDSRRVVRWSPTLEPDLPDGSGVLLADDVHLAAADDLRALARWDGGVVAAHRPTGPDAERVLDALDGAPLVLEPLGTDRVSDLLAAQWGTDPAEDVADELRAASGGVPRLLVAIAGAEPVDAATGTATLDQIIRSERQRLDDAGRSLLDAAATLAGMDLSVLAAAADLPVDAAARAAQHLAEAGLALDAGGRVPPVVAEAVRRLVPASERAVLVERAADTAVRMDHDVAGLAECIRGLGVSGPAAARCLLIAGRQALDDDLEHAATWIAAAGAGEAPPRELAALRALIGYRRGRVADTVAAVDELLRGDHRWRDSALCREAVEAGAAVLASQGAWERCAALAAAIGPHDGDAVALAAVAELATGDGAGLRALADGADADPAAGLRAAASSALARGLAGTLDDDPSPALPALLDATRLYDLAGRKATLPVAPRTLAAVIACNLWEFEIASQIITGADADGGPSPHTTDVALLDAWIGVRLGDWVGALATAERVRGDGALTARDALTVCAVEAGVARRRGDLGAMDRAWREARMLLLRQTPDVMLVQPVGELLIVGARLGDRGTVHTALTGVQRLLARADRPPLWTVPLLWDQLHVAIALDDLDAARTIARTVRARAGTAGRAPLVVEAAACWVDALSSTADPTAVRATSQQLAGAGLTWEASRLAGAAAIRMSDSAVMRDLLQFARTLTVERTPTMAVTSDTLSPRERDVAAHLLAGLTYREIGGQLYIAPKTVEHHVARIRRKLGVRSRAELLVALRRHVAVA